MQLRQKKVFFMLLLGLLALFLVSCPKDEDDDCATIEGDWDFTVVETWDCDNQAETTPDPADIIITQTDCEISFTGTFRKSLGGIMTGTIEGSTFSIDYYDNNDGCTLRIRGNVDNNEAQLSGTWEDDCYDAPDNCWGESGSFTALPD